ncbi:MAG: hypothetical protein KAT41_01740 [Candidatus Marinimicrobia bacterium]|nr:hypothetical protein [Candidatus Neomarinimicrobiota bacterium]
MELTSLNLLEEKIRNLLSLVVDLRAKNKRLMEKLEVSTSIETEINDKERQQLRKKIEGMLELLEKF